MQIINSLNDIKTEERTAIALGNFDGIHVGHRAILEDAIRIAAERGLKSVCYTFSNHPFNYIMNRDENDPDGIKLICTEEQKIRMLEEMGFDILVNVPFDGQMMTMRAMDFIEDVLVNGLNAAAVCVGFNYSFGARAEGKSEMLIREGLKHDIDVRVHDAVAVDGKVVSSTLIRKTIAEGDMEKVALYLGRDYAFEGIVQTGRRIGSTIGFPTANLPAPVNRALPCDGVYFGRIELRGESRRCIINMGCNPTVSDGSIKTIETHIFDYDGGDCYGEKIAVYFEHFHRPEMQFADKEELHRQIASDCEEAKAFRV
ncbi:MAG: bifunctional riboflavin kinase/FAD synthetase [Clostridiales bacterium]|nr:bifunctional riboflavin kinase/FAD synthetase [Candidatus Crickella caballi]